MEQLTITRDNVVDLFQVEISKQNTFDAPVIHLFTPGLYTRQILMEAKPPKGEQAWHISKVHKTTHTFCVSAGLAAIYNGVDGAAQIIEAPFTGITIKGSRRILYILEDMVFTTSHPLPYITGEENSWSPELKEMLLMRIENDLVETREINEEELLWHSRLLAQV